MSVLRCIGKTAPIQIFFSHNIILLYVVKIYFSVIIGLLLSFNEFHLYRGSNCD